MRHYRPVWARITTNLLSPPVVLLLLADYVLLHDSVTMSELIVWSSTYALFAIVLPGLYVGWEIYRGEITDIHMPRRAERLWPFFLGLTGTIFSWCILLISHAPANMMLFATFTVLYMVIITTITFFWKISAHTSALTGAVVIVGSLSGPYSAITLVPLVILVGLARVILKRHTIAQVMAGAALGAIVATAVFMFNR